MVDEFDAPGSTLDGDFPDGGPTGPVELPPAELGNLPDIAQVRASARSLRTYSSNDKFWCTLWNFLCGLAVWGEGGQVNKYQVTKDT